MSKLMIISVS